MQDVIWQFIGCKGVYAGRKMRNMVTGDLMQEK